MSPPLQYVSRGFASGLSASLSLFACLLLRALCLFPGGWPGGFVGRWGRGLRLHPLLRGSLLVLWGWLRVPLVLGGGGAVAPPPGASCTLLSVSAPAPGASALVLAAARLERSAPLSWPGCQLSALQPRTLCSPSSPLPPLSSCWSPSPPWAACLLPLSRYATLLLY